MDDMSEDKYSQFVNEGTISSISDKNVWYHNNNIQDDETSMKNYTSNAIIESKTVLLHHSYHQILIGKVKQ